MNTTFDKGIKKINVQLDDIIEWLSKFNHRQLNFKPSDTEWSIMQVFQHLIAAETNTNLYLRKKILAGNNLKEAGIGTKIKTTLLRRFMYTPLKFKAPAGVDVKMDEEYDFEDRVKQWRNQRSQLISFLSEVDDAMANKLLFKHGIGIRMNLDQMLQWTFVHADRHSKQIERIIKDPKFPSSS